MIAFPKEVTHGLLLLLLLFTSTVTWSSGQTIDCNSVDCDGTVSCAATGEVLCLLTCLGVNACNGITTTIDNCGNKDCAVACDGVDACGSATFSASSSGCADSNCAVFTDRSDTDNSVGLTATAFDEYDINIGAGFCGSCCIALNEFDNDNNPFIHNACVHACDGNSCGGPNTNFRASCRVGRAYLGGSPVAFLPPSLVGVEPKLLEEFICVLGSIVPTTPATNPPTPATNAPTPATEAPTPATEAPTPGTEAPTPATEAPTPATEAPTPATEAPTGATDAPTGSTEAPTTAAPTATHEPTASSAPVVTPAPSAAEAPDMMPFIAAGGVCGAAVLAAAVVYMRRRRKQPQQQDSLVTAEKDEGLSTTPKAKAEPATLRPTSAYMDKVKRSDIKSIFRPSDNFLAKAEEIREAEKLKEIEDIEDAL